MMFTGDRQPRRGTAALLIALLAYGAGHEAVAAQNAPGPKQYDYGGAGAPDAAMVRRVTATLGVGKTVDVRTTDSKKLRGKIQSIEERGFTVKRGRSSVAIAYDEVTQLKPVGMHRAAKIAIGAGGVYGGLFLLWMLGLGR